LLCSLLRELAYRTYLQSVRHALPESVFALASSDWYFLPSEHRCPHDAWLESIIISEPSTGERHELRSASIRIRLLGAYHDGFIEDAKQDDAAGCCGALAIEQFTKVPVEGQEQAALGLRARQNLHIGRAGSGLSDPEHIVAVSSQTQRGLLGQVLVGA
jgi:hypothetical protein